MSERRYGWRKQLPDHRDFKFSANFGVLANLPPLVDLRPQDVPIVDQGQLGSCTVNALADLLDFDRKLQGGPLDPRSRLQAYYDVLALEGNTGNDAGAEIRDVIKCAVKIGVGAERLWPYDISKFAVKPPPEVYADAAKNQVLTYSAVSQNLCQMKAVVAQGRPFEIGFSVFDSFESLAVERTGIVPMPDPSESLLGGHAVCVMGYDDSKRWFIMRNSWGTSWGDAGYFYMPYEYLLNADLSSDFWNVQTVEQPWAA